VPWAFQHGHSCQRETTRWVLPAQAPSLPDSPQSRPVLQFTASWRAAPWRNYNWNLRLLRQQQFYFTGFTGAATHWPHELWQADRLFPVGTMRYSLSIINAHNSEVGKHRLFKPSFSSFSRRENKRRKALKINNCAEDKKIHLNMTNSTLTQTGD